VPQIVLILLILSAIYGVIIAGLAWLIRRWQATHGHAVFLSFLTFGLASGLLAVLLWPADSSVFPNAFGVWVGEWIYVHAIEQIGDPHSSQAHSTIPWFLRVPQVYVITSTGLFALMGLVLQRIVDRLRN
jgi:hypothetical protein